MAAYISYKKFELLVDKKDIQKSLRVIGKEIAKTAKALIMAPKSGVKHGKHTASAPGEAPASLTGVLGSSMKVSVSGTNLKVTDSAPYAVILESGAEGGGKGKGGKSGKSLRAGGKRFATTSRQLKPRPYLTTALDNTDVQGALENSLENIIKQRTTFK